MTYCTVYCTSFRPILDDLISGCAPAAEQKYSVEKFGNSSTVESSWLLKYSYFEKYVYGYI